MVDPPEPTVLAIDAGTTGVTAIAYDLALQPVAHAYAEFAQHFPAPGLVEHDAAEILEAVDRVTASVVASTGTPRAVGITNQRETVFALERSTGSALARGIVWQDRRTAARCRELTEIGHGELVRERTGLVLDPYFSGTKIEWLLANDAAVAAAAKRDDLVFVTVDALLVHHLTRGERVATDPTNASRTMLFDIEKRAYDDELMGLFGVGRQALAEVVESAGDFGLAHLAGADETVPIRGILGDQQAALYGQGCWEAGTSKNTYGTGCFVMLNTGADRARSRTGLITTLAADRAGHPCFALEGSAFAGGTVVQWLRDQLGVLENASDSEAIARSVDDAAGVVLVPAFAGLGAPYWDPDARAALFGMTRGTTRAHIVRAGLDAIAFQCTDLIRAVREDSGLDVLELLVDGGAAANDYLMQRQADLADVRVVRPASVETTARGAAAIAAVGAGLIDDPGAVLGGSTTTFEPHDDDEARERDMGTWHDAVRRVRTNG
ncbi:MAG: glycerol kinase GlpK [Planctomycetota bacterium]